MSVADALSATDRFEVTVLTARLPSPQFATSTSEVAAAFWYPFHAGPDYDKAWAVDTHGYFLGLTRDPSWGVRLEESVEYFWQGYSRKEYDADLWWRNLAKVNLAPAQQTPATVAGHPIDGGITFRVPIIDMGTYLRRLLAELRDRNVQVVGTEPITDPDRLLNSFDAAINCTGLGARQMFAIGSPERQKMRAGVGQIVIIPERVVERLHFVHRGPDPTRQPVYVVPRENTTVLGGTIADAPDYRTEQGIVAESGYGVDLPAATPHDTDDIIERCKTLAPELQPALEKHRDNLVAACGARPFRGEDNSFGVRLAVEPKAGGKVLAHCYGHGGGGVSLAHGCALGLARRVSQLLAD